MSLEISNLQWNNSSSYEKKYELNNDEDNFSILNLSAKTESDESGDTVELGDKGDAGDKDVKGKSDTSVNQSDNVQDAKLKKTENSENVEEEKPLTPEELTEKLSELAKTFDMNDDEAKSWVEDVLSKAQQVHDNVYDECINKLGKTKERAEFVANFAFEMAVNTMIQQAEQAYKDKQMKGAFV